MIRSVVTGLIVALALWRAHGGPSGGNVCKRGEGAAPLRCKRCDSNNTMKTLVGPKDTCWTCFDCGHKWNFTGGGVRW